MTLILEHYHVIDVRNPSKECVEIVFYTNHNKYKKLTLTIFETQVKYILTEEYQNYKKLKIYMINDNYPIVINFSREEYQLHETFFLSLYNKNI